MFRAVVNVAYGEHYLRGQERLRAALRMEASAALLWPEVPLAWPPVPYGFKPAALKSAERWPQVPYGFKPAALKSAERAGADVVLWLDAAVKIVRPLKPLWERIERDGYWFGENAWNNYQWTADSAYPALFPESFRPQPGLSFGKSMDCARSISLKIPQVMACAFGLNLRSKIGAAFLREYYRLASETDAFCGPWWNSNNPANRDKDPGKSGPCGPPDVIGHRHDQTAASLIAWRMGMRLTPGHRDPEGDILAYPEWFPERKVPERCILIHDGSMK